MLLAPVLQDVAARVSGAPADQRLRDPARWAYALRDAVALAHPHWIVTHHDLELEATGAAEQAGALDDLLDVELSIAGPGRSLLELTATLAGIYPTGVVAASLTGPATMAVRFARKTSEEDCDLETAALDCGDVLAALAAGLVEHGATRVLVWEHDGDGLGPGALVSAHEPILRRLKLAGVEAVAVGSASLLGVGYAALAWPGGGDGAAVLGPEAFASPEGLDHALTGAESIAGADGLVLSDGPVPGDRDMGALRHLGERGTELEIQGGER